MNDDLVWRKIPVEIMNVHTKKKTWIEVYKENIVFNGNKPVEIKGVFRTQYNVWRGFYKNEDVILDILEDKTLEQVLEEESKSAETIKEDDYEIYDLEEVPEEKFYNSFEFIYNDILKKDAGKFAGISVPEGAPLLQLEEVMKKNVGFKPIGKTKLKTKAAIIFENNEKERNFIILDNYKNWENYATAQKIALRHKNK